MLRSSSFCEIPFNIHTMNRTILISSGAVVLATLAFVAGRLSITDAPPAAEKTTAARIQSTPPGQSSESTGEITKTLRPATAPGENAQALLNQLASLSVTEGSARSVRPVLVLLEQLSRMGTKALPAVRQFLASGKDVTYAAPGGKRLREVKSFMNAVVPLSLRTALFDVIAQSGGKDSETILAENLDLTRRGIEVAYLSELLEQMAPGNYRNATVSTATKLLANGDAADRSILFEVMKSLGDTSYVATAQRQIIQPDGQVDREALRYLQQAMGPQSLDLAARMYQDPRLVEPGSKEPLARVALSCVGANPQAVGLFHTAVLDPSLLPDQKRNLVEDLNQDGISNRKAPTREDLQIIAKRYELTQAYLQQDYVQNDNLLNAAFHEANKDLRKMLEKATAANPAP